MNSFNPDYDQKLYQASSARWPAKNPAIKTGAKSTMGYKGIISSYLPSSTVPLKTVKIPGCQERLYL